MLNKKRILVIGIVFLISLVVFSSFLNNSNALQNDSDLSVTLHGQLISNSAEVSSELMPTGTYTYFQDPELSVGEFNHDITHFNIESIQYSNESNAGTKDYKVTKGVNDTEGNHSLSFSDIPYYELGAGFDTFIILNENYTVANYINYSNNPYGVDLAFQETFDTNEWRLMGVNPVMTVSSYSSHDACATTFSPNTPDPTNNLVETASGTYTYWTYIGSINRYASYLSDNKTSASIYNFYVAYNYNYGLSSYATSSFDENTLTWNNKPASTSDALGTLASSGTGWKSISLGTTYYDYYVFKPDTSYCIWYSDEGTHRPTIEDYLSKIYQGSGSVYAQTNIAGELLTLQSPVYTTTNLNAYDYLSVDITPKCNDQLNISLLLNGIVQRNLQVVADGNTDQNQRIINVTVNSDVSFDQINVFGTLEDTEYFKLYDIKAYNYVRGNFIENVCVENFNYQILGVDYYENYTLAKDAGDYNEEVGNYTYHFDSTMFTQYDYTHDVVIPNQNLTIVVELAFTLDTDVYFLLNISYSTGVWRIPSDINLKLNGVEVNDETYNSGYAFLDTFPNTLVFTADSPCYFKFNSSTDFSFTFDLEVISRTHLEKEFELVSDHLIYFTRIDFSIDLDIKVIYLNTINLGYSNPNILSPEILMNTGNKYRLVVILAEEIYIPLTYYYDNLGTGTSNIYLSGISNTLKYYDLTRFSSITLVPPSQMLTEQAFLQFSDLQYTPDYAPTPLNDTYGYGSTNDTWSQENVSYNNEYYQTSANGTKVGENGGTESTYEYDESFTGTTSDTDEYYDTRFVNQSANYGEYHDTRFSNKTTVNNTYYGSPDNFNDEPVGESGTDIAWINTAILPNGCTAKISAELNGHKNILNISNDGLGSTPYIYHIIDVPETSGMQEWWWGSSDVSKSSWFVIRSSSTEAIVLYLTNSKYWYYNSAGNMIEITGVTPSNNILTHFKLVFNCSTSLFDLYINSVKRVNAGTFRHSVTSISRIWIYLSSNVVYSEYIDAWGDVADANYKEGYNTNPYDIVSLISIPDSLFGLMYGFESEIMSSVDGHNHVLRTKNSNSLSPYFFLPYYASMTSNGIEFWYRTENNTIYTTILLRSPNNTTLIQLLLGSGGKIKYYNGTTYTDLCSIDSNTWNHIRIEVETVSVDRWSIYVNGTKYGDFSFVNGYDTDYVRSMCFYETPNGNINHYIDALCFSWDHDYIMGYNTNPYDSIELASIPGMYFGLMYGFESEIMSSVDGHNHVLRTINWAYSPPFYPKVYFYAYQLGALNRSSGSIEFWYRTEDNSQYSSFVLQQCGNSQSLVGINFGSSTPSIGKIKRQINDTGFVEICSIDSNIWNHIRIDFETGDGAYQGLLPDNWRIYINGTKYGDFSFVNGYNASCVNIIHSMIVQTTNISFYIDAICFSWDTNYLLGDNVNSYNISAFKSKGWTMNYAYPSSYIRMNSSVDGHTDVLEMLDNTNTKDSSNDYVQLIMNFTSQESGTIEFWIRSKSVSYTYYIYIQSSTFDRIMLVMSESKFKAYYGSAWHDISDTTVSNNIWYEVRIEFECGANKYKGLLSDTCNFYLDDDFKEIIPFSSVASTLSGIKICTSVADASSNYVIYLDDFQVDSDTAFRSVDALWISDTVVVSHQLFTTSWKAQDMNVSHVIISNNFQTITQNIYNITLVNNTLQSKTWFNESSGFYVLNFTFYDKHDNWERWTLNFTLYSEICISIAYRNPVFVLESNNMSVHIQSADNLYQVYRDNSSNYIKQWEGSALVYEFSFSVVHSVKTTYNISILAKSLQGDSFYVNITGLSVIKRSTNIDIHGMKQSYLQSEYIDMSVSLNDVYNSPISDSVRYHLYDPSTADVMNGAVLSFVGFISFGLDITWTPGYYHLNCSYPETNQYCTSWELMSFEVYPIERPVDPVSNQLKVNGMTVPVSGAIQINYTNSLSFTGLDNTTFDLDIYCVFNHSHAINYNEYLSDSFTFTASSQFTSIQIAQANLSNIPTNFTDFYFNDQLSTNYVLLGNNLQINNLIGDLFYNGNSFDVRLSYIYNQKRSVQLTTNPTSEATSVVFEEYLYANRSFSYWYFVNSLEINDIELEHIRTGTTIDTFTVNGSMYYFTESSLSGDQFTATVDYNPNFINTIYSYTTTGVSSDLTIKYKADLDVSNVSMIVDLSTINLWMDTWDRNATQNPNNLKLTVPHINFTSTYQTLTLHGVSSVPSCSFASFEPQGMISVDGTDRSYDYYGFIDYSTFSQSWLLQGIKSDWVLDGVHYGFTTMNIRKSDGYFTCTGYGSSITESYLKFKGNPITEYYIVDNNIDTITINVKCNLPTKYALIYFSIPSAQRYMLTSNLQNLTSISKDVLGTDLYMFLVDRLSVGSNKIEIKYTIYSTNTLWPLLLLLVIMTIGIVAFYWYSERKRILKEVELMNSAERRKYYRAMAAKGGLLTQWWRQFKDLFRKKSKKEKAKIKKALEQEKIRKEMEKPRVL